MPENVEILILFSQCIKPQLHREFTQVSGLLSRKQLHIYIEKVKYTASIRFDGKTAKESPSKFGRKTGLSLSFSILKVSRLYLEGLVKNLLDNFWLYRKLWPFNSPSAGHINLFRCFKNTIQLICIWYKLFKMFF